MSGRLEGKVAVVTGGGNGIGRACCERFAEEGAAVVVADLLDGPGGETVEAVERLGSKATFVHLDAASPADNATMVRTAVEAFGGIDVLVTAAGISHANYQSGDRSREVDMIARQAKALENPALPFLELTLDDWQRVVDVNLTGTFLAVQAAAAHMVETGRKGSIVTIASVAAKNPNAGPLPYAVSKSGVWMLTKHVARSLGPAGIRINAIGPGFIDTNMTQLLQDIPEIHQQFLATLPLQKMGTPRDIANTALFLATDEAAYYTGAILHPDGGYFTG